MVSKKKKSNGNEESRVKEVYWEEWKDDTTTKVFWSKLTLERAQYLDTGSIMCQYKPAEGIDVSQKNYIKNRYAFILVRRISLRRRSSDGSGTQNLGAGF